MLKKLSSLKFNFEYICVLIATSLASIFGFNLGGILSSKNRLLNIFMIEVYDVDSMICTFLLGAIVGSFLGGKLCSDAGRMVPMVGSFFFGVLGEISAILSLTFSMLFISEFTVGVSFGVYLISALSYITEISSANKRGSYTSLLAFFFILGTLLAVLLSNFIPYNENLGAFLILVVGSLLIILAVTVLPESPRYLALLANSDLALRCLLRLRKSNLVAARELASINECAYGDDNGINYFFKHSFFRQILGSLALLVLLCHAAGMVIIPYMSLRLVHFTNQTADFISVGYRVYLVFYVLCGNLVIALLASALCSRLIEKFGRKGILLSSIVGNEIALVILYFVNYAFSYSVPLVISIAVIFIFIFSSTMAITVIITSYLPELLPLKGRGFGLSILAICNLGLIMLSIYLFNLATAYLSNVLIMSFFIVAQLILFLYIYFVMPETQGKYLESMENILSNSRRLLSINKER